jgi:superfamily II DNA or RNA helicase
MKLAAALEHDFDHQTRYRGAMYFRSGAVRVQLSTAKEFQARVQGSRMYEVEIEWEAEEGLNLYCDCPYFDSHGPCKHLWATILCAESQGFLRDLTPRGAMPVVYDFDESLYEDPEEYFRPAPRPVLPPPPPAPKPPKLPAWRQQLNEVTADHSRDMEIWPPQRQLLYVIDATQSNREHAVIVRLQSREPKVKGGWKKPAPARITRTLLPKLPGADRQILGLLLGVSDYHEWGSSWSDNTPGMYQVRDALATAVVPLIAATGRAMLQLAPHSDEFLPLAWDSGEAWQFQLRFAREDKRCFVTGNLRRGDEEMDLNAPAAIVEGFLITRERIARLEAGAPMQWITHLRGHNRIEAPAADSEQFLGALIEHPMTIRVDVPDEMRYQETHPTPRPCLTVRAGGNNAWEREHLRAELSFDYAGRRISENLQNRGVYDSEARTLLVRDPEAEGRARGHLLGIGVTPLRQYGMEPAWAVSAKKLPMVARACLEAGWHVEAEGKTFRRPGAMRVEVSSGVDWFELHGQVEYGETTAKLPALLAALRRGENMVRLDDGTYGLLPEEWLSRFGLLADVGTAEADHLRFRRNQAGLLDALLAAQPEASCDETFARVRTELLHFEGVRAAEQPAGFEGQLRGYQREGVGWMAFLRRFGFGGCLADDMGVGKTAQVLALLEQRRILRGNGANGHERPVGPSLVVVPKSLVFNWKQEAARFTPQLRILDHTGTGRNAGAFASYDVILTTYGTLRRDALEFKDIEFDYVVLDEAQAIKNAGTESAKAVRLLRSANRLALSGTPVENHLGELWSLFEFLNPGMLGAASVFKMTGGAARNPGEETRRLLAHALRPFILRRTKEQVARELPAKTEQTIFCELEPPQRKLYNELRAHYRNSLLRSIETQGLAKSKIQVLEALLRLRQAACHPGLLDTKRLNDPSAKLDLLMDHLSEVVEEGHKALVFSQFTSLLAILRKRLDEAGIIYEYLDGATNNRQEHVERFQNDSDCQLFLISLKAGGLGLNLTAAEYVFLLDPWWNPAVEAQAVDRAHRIGQTKQVFAYRLIAKDTVEEKVLELQNTRRDLASAIISADNSPLRDLKREDLELLLS